MKRTSRFTRGGEEEEEEEEEDEVDEGTTADRGISGELCCCSGRSDEAPLFLFTSVNQKVAHKTSKAKATLADGHAARKPNSMLLDLVSLVVCACLGDEGGQMKSGRVEVRNKADQEPNVCQINRLCGELVNSMAWQ